MTASKNAAIVDCVSANPTADQDYRVQARGRPERDPVETARRILRRKHFGNRMRELRNGASLTLAQAANLAGVTSPRKLSQYETTCYPPGEVIVGLAPHYGVSEKDLAGLVLAHSDPDLFKALTGNAGYEPSRADIAAFINANADGSA
ncbi:helix-turn-helix domain-containing protein [Leisingera sp. XS_AS12]|uniref:helix-turn-helix domain-containing protein n=1 Tax=Leisingera sp. XS_AS12 TaxID=3241294 RepID=UPI0035190E05